ASAGQLCAELLLPATQVPESAIGTLVDRAQGAPGLLVELVRGLRRDGLVQEQQGGGGYCVAAEVLDKVPDLVLIDWLAAREVERLSSDLASHARLASLLSPEFSEDELDGIVSCMDAELCRSFPLDSRAALLRLQQAGVLTLRSTGKYAFTQRLVRDALAEG